MVINHSATAGTLESSDALITVEPGEGGIALDVTDAKVTVVDKGALDCTLKARVECAVFRSCDKSASDIPWGGVIQ